MDLLFKRYASPWIIIDEMILCDRFSEFVTEFSKTLNQEAEDDAMWQYYLHHPFIEISFEEFRRRIGVKTETEEIKAINFETTVKNSMEILDGFVPE